MAILRPQTSAACRLAGGSAAAVCSWASRSLISGWPDPSLVTLGIRTLAACLQSVAGLFIIVRDLRRSI